MEPADASASVSGIRIGSDEEQRDFEEQEEPELLFTLVDGAANDENEDLARETTRKVEVSEVRSNLNRWSPTIHAEM